MASHEIRSNMPLSSHQFSGRCRVISAAVITALATSVRNSSDAQFQKEHLPADVGNEKGEPVVVERQVRISAMPGRDDDGIAISASRLVSLLLLSCCLP